MATNPEGHSPRYWRRHPGAKEATIAKKDMAPLESSQTKRGFRWDFTLAFTVAIMGILLVLFPPDNAAATVVWLVTIFICGIYPILHLAEFISQGRARWAAYSIALVVLAVVVGRLGIRLWPPHSQLSLKSTATNLVYAEGTSHAGIDWKNGYSDVRLMIKNPEPSIQNLDLSLQMDKSIIFQMGQLSTVPGCEFNAVDFPADLGARINTANGGNIFLSLKDTIRMAMKPSSLRNLTHEWRMYCPRLIGHGELELILAVPPPTAPENIRVVGSYQLMPNDGNKAVKVDEAVPVQQ
jgi:hypothetical protein